MDTSNYKSKHGQTTVASNRQFNWSDGFFVPVDFQEAPTGALIKNGNSSIALEKDEININTGTLNATATTNITGATTITGDVTITGNITVTGNVTASANITGLAIKGATVKETTTNVSLGTHTHGSPTPVTPAPTPGS